MAIVNRVCPITAFTASTSLSDGDKSTESVLLLSENAEKLLTFFFSGSVSILLLLLSLANVDSRSSQYWHCLQAQCQDLINLYSSWCRFLFLILELASYLKIRKYGREKEWQSLMMKTMSEEEVKLHF